MIYRFYKVKPIRNVWQRFLVKGAISQMVRDCKFPVITKLKFINFQSSMKWNFFKKNRVFILSILFKVRVIELIEIDRKGTIK